MIHDQSSPRMGAFRTERVRTSHGELAVELVGQKGPAVLLIHGNSSCRGVFRQQMNSMLAEGARLIALDLPGHGDSDDAIDPERTYTRSGLAEASVELLHELGIADPIVVGWSMGGHIGIEMIHRVPGLRGLAICGTPPVAPQRMSDGFVASPAMGLAGKAVLSGDEQNAFLTSVFGHRIEPFLRQAVARADGRFRKRVFEAARAGNGVDQQRAIETCRVPVAVINGADDRLVNLDFLDRLSIPSLWTGRCHRIASAGHACFWQAPVPFNALLERLIQEVG